MALRLLEEEVDHHRVLVDITNAVLSHLDLNDLIADVAGKSIIFSVWLQSVLVLGILKEREVQPVVQRSSASHCACLPRNMPGDSVLLTQTLQT
ncbi:hypothetical protein ACLBOM_12270 [Escherichia coli]